MRESGSVGMGRNLGSGLLAAWLACACATSPPPDAPPEPAPPSWSLFEPLPEGTVFGPSVRLWQAERELESLTTPTSGSGASPLAEGFAEVARELRQEIATRVVGFVRVQTALYYAQDTSPVDVWPTLDEVLTSGADDCDGLDLLTFELLRRFGFGEGEIYRAVLRRSSDGFHHMVTLWLAPGHGADPLVLDGTGYATREMVALSGLAAWEPQVIFDEASAFAPVRDGLAQSQEQGW